MADLNTYIQRLLEAEPLRQPLLRSIIKSLDFAEESRGLDAGCGIGLQSLLLAEAVGPEGHITGVDILPGLLVHGAATVAKLGLSGRIHFREGDVACLPFEDNTFDWVWSADCIGYPAGDLLPLLKELMRVVRPGGEVILLGWTSQQLLPGYPLLEARLNATCSGYIPFLQEKSPDANFLRASYWFKKAGLENVRAQTFLGEVQSPFAEGERTALLSLFDMLWGSPQAETRPEDWQEFQRLCKEGSPNLILDLPDYYAFFTYSVFRGCVPQSN